MAENGDVHEYDDYTQESTFVEGSNFHIDIPINEQCPVDRLATRHDRVCRSALRKDGFVPDLKGRSLDEVQKEADRIKVGQYFKTWYDFNRCLDSLAVLTGRGAAKYATKPNYCVRVCKFGKLSRGQSRLRSRGAGVEAVEAIDNAPLPTVDDSNLLAGTKTASVAELDHAVRGAVVAPERTTSLSVTTRVPLGPLHVNQNLALQQGISGNCVEINIGAVTPANNASARQPRPLVRHTRAWLPRRDVSRHGKQISQTGACGQLTRFVNPESDDSATEENDGTSDCPFRVRAHCLKKTGRIQITKADTRHTCAQFPHKWRGPTHNSAWMAVTLAPWVVRNTRIPVKEMLDGFSMDYHRNSIYPQMWRAKDHVRDWYLGGQRASFHRIPALCARLVETDPSSIVTWCTQEDSTTFRRAFVCPSATRHALQYVQPMICLDACHTKNRKYPTQLFLATALDGNSKVLILCYAIAEVESMDNWVWFLQQMHRALHGIDNMNIPIMSDRQKGLMAAVREVFPGKVHAHCANHLRANVKKNFGKGAELFFVALVYANTKSEFDNLLERLKKGANKGAAAVSYIQKLDASLWARHAFPLPRLGKVSSNPAEQANSGLLPIREFAPFKLMVELMHCLTIQFKTRRIKARTARDMYTDTAMLRHNQNVRHYQQWQVIDDGHHTAKVLSRDGLDEFLVKLHPRVSCTCFELQEMLWPCEHIMAWDDKEGKDFRRHFHRCWKTSSLRSLYAPTLPCFLVNDLLMTTDCFPPTIAIRKGRHRMVRIESGRGGRLQRSLDPSLHIDSEGQLFLTYPVHDDPGNMEGMPLPGGSSNTQPAGQGRKRKASNNPGKRKCGLCRGLGHNRRSCHLAGQPEPDPHENEGPTQDTPLEQDVLPLTASAPLATQDEAAGADSLLNYAASTDDERSQRQLTHSAEWDSPGVVPIARQNDLEQFVDDAAALSEGEDDPQSNGQEPHWNSWT